MSETDIAIPQEKDLLNELYSAKKVIYDCGIINKKEDEYEQKYQKILEEKKKIEGKISPLAYVIVIFSFIIGLTGGIPGVVIGIVLGLIISAIVETVLFDNKRSANAQAYFDKQSALLENYRLSYSGDAAELCNSDVYKKTIELIPEDYFDSESLDWIIKSIENKRADSLKEALNMYEDYLHKNRLEEMQYNQMVATQQTAKAQMEASKSIKEIAKTNQVQTANVQAMVRNTNRMVRNTNATTHKIEKYIKNNK